MGSVSQRVLLIGDSQSSCARLGRFLQEAGFQVDATACLVQATSMLDWHQGKRYCAVIIHQNAAPDALAALCRKARSADRRLVIIALLIRFDAELDLELLYSGVDDTVTDQHLPQAVARRVVMKLDRRRDSEIAGDGTYIGDVQIDLANARIRRDGDYTTITVREAKMLSYLLRNAGKTISRRDLRRSVWNDSDADPLGRTIDVFISRLRKLIEPDRKRPIYLKTVHGYGYKLDLQIPEPPIPNSIVHRHPLSGGDY